MQSSCNDLDFLPIQISLFLSWQIASIGFSSHNQRQQSIILHILLLTPLSLRIPSSSSSLSDCIQMDCEYKLCLTTLEKKKESIRTHCNFVIHQQLVDHSTSIPQPAPPSTPHPSKTWNTTTNPTQRQTYMSMGAMWWHKQTGCFWNVKGSLPIRFLWHTMSGSD